MGSNHKGEVNCNLYSEGRERVSITKKNVFPMQRNGRATPSRQSSQTPEYVKRTAKLFETVQITKDLKNGERETFSSELSYLANETDARKTEKETVRISLDCLDGECNKKPSYVGVSCSNSGYRNVINYDSKLREGFWSANSQRESLVLSSSRMRESSPLRRDFDYKSHNGSTRDTVKVADIRIEQEAAVPLNGVSRPEKFVNISTSTKTISTFRDSKDVKAEDLESAINGGTRNFDGGCGDDTKVNLKQILNGKNNEPYRKGYSNLGFSPKILKSPEKNCNSFLKSISSFENNCKKSQMEKSSTYVKTEQRVCDSSNSIQQRIERLYGPGALAQGFYTQKSQSKTKIFEKSTESSDGQNEIPLQIKPQSPTLTPTVKSNTNPTNSPQAAPMDAAPTENYSNGHSASESVPDPEGGERSGHYFLSLLKKETDRLEHLASFAESELENGENLPEEVSGKLRAAAGKARLLVCQKLHQFEGLCHKNLNEKPGEQFPTTNEDLAGFWDMVMLQVVQVHSVFDELKELKKNNWKVTVSKKGSASPATNGQSQQGRTTVKKSPPNSTTPEKQSLKSESAKKAREEERRKLLEERRKKMKELKENKIMSADNEVEIFAK